MKKRMLIVTMVVLFLTASVSSVWAGGHTGNADKSGHKIKNKWDLSGTFEGDTRYHWAGVPDGATWTYSIHVKEAMDPTASSGSIHFSTGDIDVVGHVDETKREYDYAQWAGNDLLAAVGTAEYNDTTYNFMFLYAERAVWFALSDQPYEAYWDSESVWPGSARLFQVHSLVTNDYPLDHKIIHE